MSDTPVHVRVSRIIHIVCGVFGLLFGLLFVTGSTSIFGSLMGLIVGIYFLVVGTAGIVVGIMLPKGAKWLVLSSMVIGGLYTISIPIGTPFGLYLLYVHLRNDDAKIYFASTA